MSKPLLNIRTQALEVKEIQLADCLQANPFNQSDHF
jgi:hypothetical protein